MTFRRRYKIHKAPKRHDQRGPDYGAGALDARRAELALADLAALPVERVAHRPLLARCWELRENLVISDAAYVALAELLDADLLTADRRLARAHRPHCNIEVLAWRATRREATPTHTPRVDMTGRHVRATKAPGRRELGERCLEQQDNAENAED